MNKFLLILLSIGIVASVHAQESSENPIQTELVTEENTFNKEDINSVTEKKPEAEIVHKIENKVISLPQCSDKKLYELLFYLPITALKNFDWTHLCLL